MTEKMRPLTTQNMLDNGLLWYLNRVALHPHGLALAIDDTTGQFFLLAAPDGIFSFPVEVDEEKAGHWKDFVEEFLHPERQVHTITDLPEKHEEGGTQVDG